MRSRVRAYWGSNHTLQIGRPFDQKRRWYCPFMLQKMICVPGKKKDLILVVPCTTFPSLFLPSFSYKINMGRVVQQIPVSTLSPASPPILPWSLSMLLYHDIMLVSSFCFLAYSSFAVFILLSYWLWSRYSPTPPPQSDLPEVTVTAGQAGEKWVLFFDFSLTDPCIPYRRDGQETMTQTEVSVPGRRLVPSSFREPNSEVSKVLANKNVHVINFNCISYRMAFQNFTPLEALEFYLLKSHSK